MPHATALLSHCKRLKPFKSPCLQDLLEAVKPILDEDLQEAVESLLLDSAVFDAKNLYNATKVLKTFILKPWGAGQGPLEFPLLLWYPPSWETTLHLLDRPLVLQYRVKRK